MYYKSHDRQKFYSTLCHTAKRNQRYNLIQSTQNYSTSVEHNSKTLTQIKFNTRQPIQNLTGPFCAQTKLLLLEPSLEPSHIISLSFTSFSSLCLSLRIHLYGKRSRYANLLVYPRLSPNPLEKALCSNAPEHSITFEIVKLGQKQITSLLLAKREKRYMYRAIENESDVIIRE